MLDRAQAELGEALCDLARLLVRVHVQRIARPGSVDGDRAQPVGRHGTHRVRRVPHGHERVAGRLLGEPIDAREIGLDGGIAEASLPGGRRAVRTAARVGRKQQRDAKADRPGCLDHGQRELVRLGIRCAVGLVVHVVKLTDRRISGAPRGVEALLGDRAQRDGIERARGGIHRFTPRPEVVIGILAVDQLHAAAQVALEGMRVPVDEPGHEQASGQAVAALGLPRGLQPDDATAAELDRDVSPDRPVRQQDSVGAEQRGRHPRERSSDRRTTLRMWKRPWSAALRASSPTSARG